MALISHKGSVVGDARLLVMVPLPPLPAMVIEIDLLLIDLSTTKPHESTNLIGTTSLADGGVQSPVIAQGVEAGSGSWPILR